MAWAAKKPLEIEEVEVMGPKEGEVLLKVIGVAGAGQTIETRPFNLVVGRTWKGTAFGGVKGRSELPGYVERYMSGQIELDSMVTHTMPLDDINRAFDLMHKGESIRSVIIF